MAATDATRAQFVLFFFLLLLLLLKSETSQANVHFNLISCGIRPFQPYVCEAALPEHAAYGDVQWKPMFFSVFTGTLGGAEIESSCLKSWS